MERSIQNSAIEVNGLCARMKLQCNAYTIIDETLPELPLKINKLCNLIHQMEEPLPPELVTPVLVKLERVFWGTERLISYFTKVKNSM